ncbi:hypothetical protein KUC3_39000 [Alteromonas sp. KC3]|uniref:ABC-three component system protein n=1 Tax=unclassified Alteromonas TaxID=2614992 RepID=UPI0019231FB7|nr:MULTISPECIES: ABC-three component system protein [unclassified Alteromonas]BCO21043.1 hypothetical protein KUC3_39000 [Alteromonas sp. KC3]BCO25013.1 hypothetical protein KUC14_38820 [Alteromonas sp. KC14]
MDVQQKLEARKAFKLRIHESHGNAFEDLFCDVMRASNQDFKKVKPQGRIGDRKNDGFIPTEGKYYQVYSPQSPSGNPTAATSKIEEDLDGLISYWGNEHNYEIKQFYFVFNDKYHGAYPEIYTTLNSVKKKYNLEVCDVFLSSELEDIFIGLSEDNIASICGYYPKPEDIGFIDNSIIAEIVGYVSQNYSGFSDSTTTEPPDFYNKIHFNNLGKNTARHLNIGAYQVGFVEDYFKSNSQFSRQQSRDSLNTMYLKYLDINNSEVSVLTGLSQSDIVFKSMVDEILPANLNNMQRRDYERNVIAVLSYFFEACDIFEEPPEDYDPQVSEYV